MLLQGFRPKDRLSRLALHTERLRLATHKGTRQLEDAIRLYLATSNESVRPLGYGAMLDTLRTAGKDGTPRQDREISRVIRWLRGLDRDGLKNLGAALAVLGVAGIGAAWSQKTAWAALPYWGLLVGSVLVVGLGILCLLRAANAITWPEITPPTPPTPPPVAPPGETAYRIPDWLRLGSQNRAPKAEDQDVPMPPPSSPPR